MTKLPPIEKRFKPLVGRPCYALARMFGRIEKFFDKIANRCAFLSQTKSKQKEVVEEAREYFLTGVRLKENEDAIRSGLENMQRALADCERKNAIYRDGLIEIFHGYREGRDEVIVRVFARFGLHLDGLNHQTENHQTKENL